MFFSGLHTILHTLVIYEMFVKTDKHFENCNGNHLLGIPIEGKRETQWETQKEKKRERIVFLYNNCIHSPQLLVRPSFIKLLLTLLIINFIELCLSFVCVYVCVCLSVCVLYCIIFVVAIIVVSLLVIEQVYDVMYHVDTYTEMHAQLNTHTHTHTCTCCLLVFKQFICLAVLTAIHFHLLIFICSSLLASVSASSNQ